MLHLFVEVSKTSCAGFEKLECCNIVLQMLYRKTKVPETRRKLKINAVELQWFLCHSPPPKQTKKMNKFEMKNFSPFCYCCCWIFTSLDKFKTIYLIWICVFFFKTTKKQWTILPNIESFAHLSTTFPLCFSLSLSLPINFVSFCFAF